MAQAPDMLGLETVVTTSLSGEQRSIVINHDAYRPHQISERQMQWLLASLRAGEVSGNAASPKSAG